MATILVNNINNAMVERFKDFAQKQGVDIAVFNENDTITVNNCDYAEAESEDYPPEFYAKIDKALQSPLVPMSREELFALLRG